MTTLADVIANPAGYILANSNKLDSILTKLTNLETIGNSTAVVLVAQADEYEDVAANATDQVLGGTGAVGDRLAGILINPTSTSPGNVIVKDGGTTIYTFAGGTNSVSNLGTIPVPLPVKSKNGAFTITTGANVNVVAIGDFSA